MGDSQSPSKTSETMSQAEFQLLVQEHQLTDSPGHLFRVFENRIQTAYYEATPRPDITPRQIAVLFTLHKEGPISQTQLARLVHVDRSTLGEMTYRMAKRGLLEREVSPDDRRTSIVRITEAGRGALFETMPPVLRAQQAFLEPLPSEYRPIFTKCMMILFDAWADSEAVG